MKPIYYALLLLLALSCESRGISKDPEIVVVTPAPVEIPGAACKTPNYQSKSSFGPQYTQALEFVRDYGNSDDFYAFLSKKYPKFTHTDKTAFEAIRLFRTQLAKCEAITIEFYSPILKGTYVGNWDGVKISQNAKFILTPSRRAGHLLHETSHKYGWIHKGNKVAQYDNVNSFPYALGYAFEEFLESKLINTKLADQ